MSHLTSYLLAQARQRPLQTLRFCAAEAVRRARLRGSAASNGWHVLPYGDVAARFQPLAPAAITSLHAVPVAEPGLLAQADAICRGELDIFGEQLQFGVTPDWHADWRTGHRWPLEEKVAVLAGPPGTDVKRPWEAARFHHGLRLAQAFRLTREPRYAEAFAQQVVHWLQNNPYPRGIHWAMPMEVALRAVNWSSAAALLADAPLEATFWQRLLASLQQHGRHVNTHREWNPVARGNHYLACVIGILISGIVFRETREGRGWLQFARRALAEEMLAQVDEDGVAHEGSSGYHLFVTELFLTGAIALARTDSVQHGANGNGGSGSLRAQIARSCGEPFTWRLETMFEFAAALTEGRPAPPIWGDADDGRVLPFCSADAEHAHHLLASATVLFDRSDFVPAHDCGEPLWRLGPAARSADAVPRAEPAPVRAFPQAGFFFFASPRLRGSIRCGPLGVDGWANHAHCDQLAFELCADGSPVLVDPGTYLYSGDAAARNALRSTRAHNTPMVEGEEQNRFWPGLLFRMMDDTRSRLLRCHSSEAGFEFAGEHYGYRRLQQPVTVRRDLQLNASQDSLHVVDTLAGAGEALAEWNFTLAPGITVRPASQSSAVSPVKPGGDFTMHSAWQLGPLRMRVWLTGDGVPDARIEPGWFAPRYGHRVAVSVLRLTGRFALPLRIAFTFALEKP